MEYLMIRKLGRVVLSRAKSVKCANNFLKLDEMKIMTGTDERQNIRCLST